LSFITSKILDGRNRYKACLLAGVEPRFEDYQGDRQTAFVTSLNFKRRDVTPSQRAAIAVEMLPFFEEEARKRQAAGPKKTGRPIRLVAS